MCAMALAARRHGRPESGQDVAQLGAQVVLDCVEASRLEAADVLVERVDEDPERQLVLQLRCAARQHEHAAALGARAELAQEPRLAEPRLPYDLERGCATV